MSKDPGDTTSGENEYFSLEQTYAIIECVNLPIEAAKRSPLHRQLNEAAVDYKFFKAEPAPAELRDRLLAVAKAANNLLTKLGGEEANDLRGIIELTLYSAEQELSLNERIEELEGIKEISQQSKLGPVHDAIHGIPSRFGRVRDAIRGIKALQLWAEHASREAGEMAKPSGKTENLARRWFARDLAGIYRETFGKEPGVSWSEPEQQTIGPFVRFLDACFECLDEKLSLSTISKIGKHAKDWNYGIVKIAKVKPPESG